jgi:hypothetical protein
VDRESRPVLEPDSSTDLSEIKENFQSWASRLKRKARKMKIRAAAAEKDIRERLV